MTIGTLIIFGSGVAVGFILGGVLFMASEEDFD